MDDLLNFAGAFIGGIVEFFNLNFPCTEFTFFQVFVAILIANVVLNALNIIFHTRSGKDQ